MKANDKCDDSFCTFTNPFIREKLKNLDMKTEIDDLKETVEYLQEMVSEYQCDKNALKKCVEQILITTDDEAIKDLIHETLFHLCENMK